MRGMCSLVRKRSAGPPESAGESRDDVFAGLWQRHARELYGRCLAWTGGRREDAEEALSRAAVLAFQKFPTRPDELTNPRGWLLRLTYNTCMDLHRERRRERAEPHDDLEALGAGEAMPARRFDESPEGAVLNAELWAYLHRCLGELPPRLRDPMRLHLLHEIRYRNIAEALAITEVNVRKRIQHGREILRRQLRQYLAGDAEVAAPELAAGRSLAHGRRPAVAPEAARGGVAAPRVRGQRSARVLLPGGIERDVVVPLFHTPESDGRRLARLTHYVDRHPNGWKRRLELARRLRERGRLEQALPHYREVAARRTLLPAVWLELATCLSSLGRSAEAAATYRDALGALRGEGISRHLKGLMARCQGRPDEALEELRKAVAAEPRNPAHWLALGEIELEAGRPQEAVEAFDAALDLDPDDPRALTASLPALEAAGLPAAAQRRARRALELDPDDFLALRAVVEQRARGRRLDRLEGAETAALLGRLEELAGERADVHATRSLVALAAGRWPDAERAIAAYTAEHPSHLRGWQLQARLLRRLGHYGRAAAAAERSLALDPTDPEAGREAWSVYLLAGRGAEAERLAESLSARHDGDWRLAITLASCPLAPDPVRAGEHAGRASVLGPRLAASWIASGGALARAGRLRRAAAELEHAWELLPADDGDALAATAALGLGRLHERRGDSAEAERWRRRALERAEAATAFEPARGSALSGDALAALGDRAGAIAAYHLALAAYLTFPLRHRVTEALALLGG